MDNITNTIDGFFTDNGIIIIIGCMIVGFIIKGTIKRIPNKFIPFINMGLSILLGFIIPGTFTDRDIVSKIIILMFLGLSSVGLYESICIILKDRLSIDIRKLIGKYNDDDNENDE